MITEQYVSFEIAKLLKEKGFNELCQYAYLSYGYRFSSRNTCNTSVIIKDSRCNCTAPTQQMVMQWLREKHNLCIIIFPIVTDDDGSAGCLWDYVISKHLIEQKRSKLAYEKYEDAVEDAIKYCLENLI